jgi:hypothetical protein
VHSHIALTALLLSNLAELPPYGRPYFRRHYATEADWAVVVVILCVYVPVLFSWHLLALVVRRDAFISEPSHTLDRLCVDSKFFFPVMGADSCI